MKNRKIKKIVTIAFLYSVFITTETYVISGFMLGSFSNRWQQSNSIVFRCYGNTELWNKIVPYLKTWIILGIIFLLLFIGLISIGILTGALRSYIDSKYAYLVLIVMIFSEITINGFELSIKRMSLRVDDFVEPQVIIVKVLFLLILAILSFIIGKGSVVKKDFFTKK